jgi:hypothetical protein
MQTLKTLIIQSNKINNQGAEKLANALKNNKILPFLSHTYFMYCVIQTLKTLDLQSSQGVRVRVRVREEG